MGKMQYKLNKDDLSNDFSEDDVDDLGNDFEPGRSTNSSKNDFSDLDDDSLEGFNGQDDDFYNTDFDDGAFGGGGIPPMEKHNDLLKELTDFSPFIKSKFYDWLGWKWDEDKGQYVEDKQADPILNYKGAKQMISILGTYARKNNIITNLDKEAYRVLVGDIIETMCYSIGVDMELYGIKSNAKFWILLNDVEAVVRLVLEGAAGGRYNELLSTTTNRSESISGTQEVNQNNVPRKGMVGKMRSMLTGG